MHQRLACNQANARTLGLDSGLLDELRGFAWGYALGLDCNLLNELLCSAWAATAPADCKGLGATK